MLGLAWAWDVVFRGILIIQYRSNASLGPEGGAAADPGLANHAYFQVLWQIESNGQAGSTTADNKNIAFVGL